MVSTLPTAAFVTPPSAAPTASRYAPAVAQERTIDAIDALVGPATPQFALQLRARVEELIVDLPDDDPVREYGEEKMDLLERLAFASSKADDSPKESRDRIGWEELPSATPAYEPQFPPDFE
jgi:hypothetical protein